MTGTGRIAADEGDVVVNDDTVRFLVPAPRTVMAADTFEGIGRGTAAASIPGWTGGGVISAGTPAAGDPPGLPAPAATHTNVLSLAGEAATRAYAGAFARDSQSFDFLVQVARQSDDGWREVFADDGALQLRLAFDEAGAPWLLHADDSGAPAWSRLGFAAAAPAAATGGVGGAAPPPFADGAWVRVSIDLDYSTNPSGLAFAQVRLDGSCLLADDGWRTPATKGAGGSWFRLPAAASAAHKVSSVEFDGALAVDDLVHAYHDPVLVPDFPAGAVTSADGIPFVWFDEQGIPRDPGGDPDGDDASNRQEWRANTDPFDRASHPPTRAILSLH
jgi:hypothetical protein